MAVVIFMAGAAISVLFRSRADRQSGNEKISLRAEGLPMRLALRLGGIALWISVFSRMINPDWMAWSQLQLPTWLRLAGGAMGSLADELMYWVFSSLGTNVTSTVVTRSKHELVTTGPYRWVRHPLYSVGFLSYVAFAILAVNWLAALLAVIAIPLIALRVPPEEQHLIARNGDADRDYASGTGRFFPKLG